MAEVVLNKPQAVPLASKRETAGRAGGAWQRTIGESVGAGNPITSNDAQLTAGDQLFGQKPAIETTQSRVSSTKAPPLPRFRSISRMRHGIDRHPIRRRSGSTGRTGTGRHLVRHAVRRCSARATMAGSWAITRR